MQTKKIERSVTFIYNFPCPDRLTNPDCLQTLTADITFVKPRCSNCRRKNKIVYNKS